MKKLFIVALAVFFIAGLVSSAYAEDRLSLSGSYRVRVWAKENYSDFDDNDDADDVAYWDQRWRIGGKIQVAEGISAHFRMDLSEAQWGAQTTTNRGWNRGDPTATAAHRQIHIDRAYARWEQDLFILTAGQAYTAFGNKIVVDQNQFGFILRFKLPVVVDLVYSKIDESGDIRDDGQWDDIDFYGGQATYKADNWKIGVLAAAINDQTDADNSPYAIGLFGNYSFGMFALKGELDTFGGDVGDRDVKGTQIWADVKANVLPNAYVGVEGWWANSTDDTTEVTITGISDSGSFVPADWGSAFNTAINPVSGLAGALGGTGKTIPEFDPAGVNAGALGFGIYGNWKFIDKWQVRAKYLYMQPQDDDLTALNDVNVFNVGVIWDCLPNTTARVGYNLTNANADGLDLDSAQAIAGMLQLKW